MKKLLIITLVLFWTFLIAIQSRSETLPLSDTQLYVVASYVPLKARITPKIASSCVLYAKWYLDRAEEFWGNAGQIKATSDAPYVGGLVLTRESPFGHVAVITSISSSSLEVIEANYIPGTVSTRSLSINDIHIRGYR